MRIASVAAALLSLVVPACVLGPTTSDAGSTGATSASTTGSTTSSTSTGGSGCDSQPTCDDCTNCATQSTCATAVAACEGNSQCVGLEQCIQLCGTTPDCASMCEMQNPSGLAQYNTKMTCFYCTACPNRCAGFAMCTKG